MNEHAIQVSPPRSSGHALAAIGDDAMGIEQVAAMVGRVHALMKNQILKPDHHYGAIPGTGGKPTLLQPGAQVLLMTFRLRPEHEITTEIIEPNRIHYTIRCRLYHAPSNTFIAEGLGSCTSLESKYRYRKADRACPSCGKATILRSKFPPKNDSSAPPGWYCFTKRGGCGANFPHDLPDIVNQKAGRVENPDIADQGNTILKMACKRALIAATLNATAASDTFTQDLDDEEVARTKAVAGGYSERRELVAAFEPYGIGPAELCAYTGKMRLDHLDDDDVKRLRKVFAAAQRGEVNLAEAFAPKAPPSSRADALAAELGAPAEEPAPPPPAEPAASRSRHNLTRCEVCGGNNGTTATGTPVWCACEEARRQGIDAPEPASGPETAQAGGYEGPPGGLFGGAPPATAPQGVTSTERPRPGTPLRGPSGPVEAPPAEPPQPPPEPENAPPRRPKRSPTSDPWLLACDRVGFPRGPARAVGAFEDGQRLGDDIVNKARLCARAFFGGNDAAGKVAEALALEVGIFPSEQMTALNVRELIGALDAIRAGNRKPPEVHPETQAEADASASEQGANDSPQE